MSRMLPLLCRTRMPPPAAPVSSLTVKYLEDLSVTSGNPVYGETLPNGEVGVIAAAPPTGIDSYQVPAADDFYRTQISGGGSVLIIEGPVDPFADSTMGNLSPAAGYDVAGNTYSPPTETPIVPQAVLDAVFTSLPTSRDFPAGIASPRRGSSGRTSVGRSGGRGVMPAVALSGDSTYLAKSVSLGIVGVGLIIAEMVHEQRKRRKLLLPVAAPVTAE